MSRQLSQSDAGTSVRENVSDKSGAGLSGNIKYANRRWIQVFSLSGETVWI